MAYATPITWTAGQIVLPSDMNAQVRDNVTYLHDRSNVNQAQVKAVANYSTTSTSFVDVDATNLIITITPTTAKVIVIASFYASITGGNSGEFDIILDSTTRAGSADGLVAMSSSTTNPVTIIARFTGLSNASHTFKLQYRATPAGTAAVYGTACVTMLGWECV